MSAAPTAAGCTTLGGGDHMPLTAFYDPRGRLVDVEHAAVSQQTLQDRIRQFYGFSG